MDRCPLCYRWGYTYATCVCRDPEWPHGAKYQPKRVVHTAAELDVLIAAADARQARMKAERRADLLAARDRLDAALKRLDDPAIPYDG